MKCYAERGCVLAEYDAAGERMAEPWKDGAKLNSDQWEVRTWVDAARDWPTGLKISLKGSFRAKTNGRLFGLIEPAAFRLAATPPRATRERRSIPWEALSVPLTLKFRPRTASPVVASSRRRVF